MKKTKYPYLTHFIFIVFALTPHCLLSNPLLSITGSISDPPPYLRQKIQLIIPTSHLPTLKRNKRNRLSNCTLFRAWEPLDDTPPTHPPSPDGQREAYTIAKNLFSNGEWVKLRCHLRSNHFSLDHQPDLQNLWFCSLYEEFKLRKGITELSPTQRYRIRRSHPLPQALSAAKFTANNNFDDRTRAIMDECYARSRYPLLGDVQYIMQMTGITSKQIKNYFKNKRSRSKRGLMGAKEIDIITADKDSDSGDTSYGPFDMDLGAGGGSGPATMEIPIMYGSTECELGGQAEVESAENTAQNAQSSCHGFDGDDESKFDANQGLETENLSERNVGFDLTEFTEIIKREPMN